MAKQDLHILVYYSGFDPLYGPAKGLVQDVMETYRQHNNGTSGYARGQWDGISISDDWADKKKRIRCLNVAILGIYSMKEAEHVGENFFQTLKYMERIYDFDVFASNVHTGRRHYFHTLEDTKAAENFERW